MTDVDIDSLAGTEFQRDVWRALLQIPRGQVRTYSWVARASGHPDAVRAVASAIARNPLPPIIPCHRVVRSNGDIGGYSPAGGVAEKRRLLEMERSELCLGDK